MDLLNHMDGVEGIDLAGSGGRPPDFHPSHRPLLTEYNRAPSHSLAVAGMPNANPLYIGDSAFHS